MRWDGERWVGTPEPGVSIVGRILDRPTGLCVWCGRVARETGYAPGLGVELPLHPTCAMSITYKWRRYMTGQAQRAELDEVRIRRLAAEAAKARGLLGPGSLPLCQCITPAHEGRRCPWQVATHRWGNGRMAKPHARCRECEITHRKPGPGGRLTGPHNPTGGTI